MASDPTPAGLVQMYVGMALAANITMTAAKAIDTLEQPQNQNLSPKAAFLQVAKNHWKGIVCSVALAGMVGAGLGHLLQNASSSPASQTPRHSGYTAI